MTDCVFVYGTLRQALHQPAHRLLAGAARVGLGRAAGRLYDLGEYPCMIQAADASVRGEVYRLTGDAMLAALDDYEEVAAGLYRRACVTVTLDNGDPVEAWVYFYNRPLPRSAKRIDSGDYVGGG